MWQKSGRGLSLYARVKAAAAGAGAAALIAPHRVRPDACRNRPPRPDPDRNWRTAGRIALPAGPTTSAAPHIRIFRSGERGAL